MNCILCSRELHPSNGSRICRECRQIVADLLALEIDERWTELDIPGTDGVIVSDRGRVARLLNHDCSERYPRVSLVGRKHYVHHLVAAAWHGPRPPGALVLHADDDPANPTAGNLRYGDHAANARDRQRNHQRKEHHQ